MLRTIRLTSILALAIYGSLVAQGETILTFDPNFTSGQAIPQDYGDNVTAAVSNGYSYGGMGAFTPNVSVSYSADGGNCDSPSQGQPYYHGGPFEDLGGCIRSINFCDSWEVTLTAGSGVLVQLHGFDLARFTGFGGACCGQVLSPDVIILDAFTQAVLFSQLAVPLAAPTHTSFDFSPALTAQAVTIRVLPTGFSNIGEKFGMDNIRFSEATGSVPPQANSAAASLQLNGAGPLGSGGPFPVVLSGGPLVFDWSGPPLAPFILFAGPLNPAGFDAGCLGTVHIGTPSLGFSDLAVILNGTSPTFPSFFYVLDGAGQAQQTLSVPPVVPGSVNLQGLVLQPGAPCPFLLTAAFQLSW